MIADKQTRLEAESQGIMLRTNNEFAAFEAGKRAVYAHAARDRLRQRSGVARR